MSIRRRRRRLRLVIAPVILAVGALAAVPASTQPVAAQQNVCTPSGPSPISGWETKFSGRGVTLCHGHIPNPGPPPFGAGPHAVVQIVDLNAGAKVRLASEPCRTCDDYSDIDYWTDLPFYKRNASEWSDWIQSNVEPPAFGSELFSTSNGSYFFTDLFDDESPFRLPEKTLFDVFPNGGGTTFGKVFDDEAPPWVWDSAKVALSLGDVRTARQSVEMYGFPPHYAAADVYRLFYGGPLDGPFDPDRVGGDQTVGFAPRHDGTARPRTFVGVDVSTGEANRVFILNTNDNFTHSEAEDILQSFGSMIEVELDGGPSTQLYALGEYQVQPYWPLPARAVPDALAVYLAP